MNALLVLPVVLVISIASRYVMNSYGAGFGNGWPTLVIVSMTAGIIAVEAPVGQIIAASGRMWIGLAMNLGWAIAFILATFLLIGHGSLGIASARLGAYLLHGIWVFAFAYRYLAVANAGLNARRYATPCLGES